MFRLRGLIEGKERFVLLEGQEVRLGRGSDNDVVLPDFSVSRRHAAIRREGEGGWFVYDQNSTNGVQVNGTTVRKAPLQSGDRLKIGIFEFGVEGELTEPAKPGPSGSTVEPPGGTMSSSISSATIVRRIEDFSADYGLEEPLRAAATTEKERYRSERDQAYASKIFSFLTRLARLLIQAGTAEEVLEKVFDIAFDALEVDRGFILLRDERSGELVCELSREGEEVSLRPEGEIPVSHTMLEEVMRERVALLTYDAQADQRLLTGESIRIHQIRSAMCAPLWSDQNIIGVMQVDSPFHAGTFNEGDLDLFTALANYAAVAVERIRNAQRVEFERQVRSRLERYHSPAVIDLVMQRGDDVSDVERNLEPARVTVLFADVVGFTPMAETLPPEEVADILKGYFNHSVEAIFGQGGTLDKFIGDCVMAFFGAPVPQEDHASRGVRAAIEIQRALDRWNRERQDRGLQPVLARIALNTGPVVVGDVGSTKRVDYTVLGNTVNVAARLESAAAGPAEIVVGSATHEELAGSVAMEALGEFQLKGLQQKVTAFRVPWREDT